MSKLHEYQFRDLGEVINGSFRILLSLWWRLAITNLLALVMMVAWGGLLFGLMLLLLGGFGAFESVYANLSLGTFPSLWITGVLFLLLAIFIVGVVLLSLLGKISGLLFVKKFQKKHPKDTNPFVVFFQKAPEFLNRYILLVLRIVSHLLGAVLLLLLVLALTGVLTHIFGENFFTIALSGVGILAAFGFGLYRITRIVFSASILIAQGKTAEVAFEKGLSITKASPLKILMSFLIFFVPLHLIASGFEFLLDTIQGEGLLILVSFLAFVFNLFILGPLAVIFIYLLMLKVAQSQKIKL